MTLRALMLPTSICSTWLSLLLSQHIILSSILGFHARFSTVGERLSGLLQDKELYKKENNLVPPSISVHLPALVSSILSLDPSARPSLPYATAHMYGYSIHSQNAELYTWTALHMDNTSSHPQVLLPTFLFIISLISSRR
jgi:hypothetical protein